MTESLAPADRLTPDTAAYAARLIEAGFTVYVQATPGHPGTPSAFSGWFHYSRIVDGVECFGTYDDGAKSFDGPRHSMPITPSRLNGSGALIGGTFGDLPTLNLDNKPADSVEYALAVARPTNWCPFNAEPTPEAVQRANGQAGVPKKYYRGATLKNARPSGIGTTYVPASL